MNIPLYTIPFFIPVTGCPKAESPRRRLAMDRVHRHPGDEVGLRPQPGLGEHGRQHGGEQPQCATGHGATVAPDPRAAIQGAATAATATASIAVRREDLSSVPLVARPSPLATASLKQKTTNDPPHEFQHRGLARPAPAA